MIGPATAFRKLKRYQGSTISRDLQLRVGDLGLGLLAASFDGPATFQAPKLLFLHASRSIQRHAKF